MTGAGTAVELSVVAPVYDERENLDALVDELVRTLDAAALQFEILLVDDGSTDGSSARIAELARASAGRVRGIHFRANRGQTAAFDAGFRAARGRVVVTIDADLQNDPRDIPRLLAALEGYDAAVGYRRAREDAWPRRAGRSKYGLADRALHAFVDLLAVRWMSKRRLGYEVVRHDL